MSAVPHDEHRDAPPALVTALDLLSRGLWPVAIHPYGAKVNSPGKQPIGDDWGGKRPTPAILRAIYAANPRAGVGIRLGPESGVVDVENDTGAEGDATLLEMMGGEELPSMGWGANRGGHTLFAYDPRFVKYGKTIIKIGGLEIRIGTIDLAEPKQLQSVCPPTAKADGTPREWNGVEDVATLPESFFAYLDRAFPEKPKNSPPPATIPIYTPRPGQWTAEDRAIRYLEKVDSAISGSDGSRPTFRAACKVGPGFDLTEERTVQILLHHYAPRCVPPWSEKEIRHKVADAFKKETRRGWMLEEGRDALSISSCEKREQSELKGVNSHTSPISQEQKQIEEDERPALVRKWPAPPDNAVWHGPAGELALAVRPWTEADPIGVLLQMLVGFGTLVGRRVFFQVGATRHYTNLFACTAGPTGAGRKGTAWDVVKMGLARCDLDFAEKRVKNGLASGEGLIYAVRDEVRRKAQVKKDGRYLEEFDSELIDEGVSDKRLLVTETEFGRTLGAMGREGNTLSSVIRQAWDSGMLDSMTKGNANRATDAHISIIAHITVDEVTKLLKSVDAANGFANRFLWAAVRKEQSLPDGFPIPLDVVRGPLDWIQAAAEKLTEDQARIARDADANVFWHDIYDSLAPARPGLIGSILGRGQPQVMRLATIYALLDGLDVIKQAHLEAALALWRYCERSAEFIFGDAMGDRDADNLLSSLRANPEGLTRTAISGLVFKGHKNRDELDRVLGRLVEANLIESVKVKSASGAPSTVWMAVVQ